jgi:prophage tail gpP-like protein/phage tail protein X
LSTTFKIITGDTFDSISRKKYGTELNADLIARANPGLYEPLTAGTTVNIPSLPGAPQNVQQNAPNDTEDEVAILIDDVRFRFWTNVNITRSIDSMDTIEFSAPFDADAPDFREIFRPFSYKSVVVTVGGDPLFTGTIIAIDPVLENAQKSVAVNGYSLPGVLNDCTPPASSYPLEFDNLGLREIATALVEPFGLGVEFLTEQGAVFERVASEPGKTVLNFLIELAQQRNCIIASSNLGKLVFLKSAKAGSPVAKLEQGFSPLLSVAPTFNPQTYFSHITGLEPVTVGLSGAQFTVKNERLKAVTRPLTFITRDTQGAGIKAAVDAKTGRMFGNMASYMIQVNTWRDPNGNLWEPNTSILLLAPGAMIYDFYEFIIRSIDFSKDPEIKTATLNLVIPGSFSGELPEVLPWEG